MTKVLKCLWKETIEHIAASSTHWLAGEMSKNLWSLNVNTGQVMKTLSLGGRHPKYKSLFTDCWLQLVFLQVDILSLEYEEKPIWNEGRNEQTKKWKKGERKERRKKMKKEKKERKKQKKGGRNKRKEKEIIKKGRKNKKKGKEERNQEEKEKRQKQKEEIVEKEMKSKKEGKTKEKRKIR